MVANLRYPAKENFAGMMFSLFVVEYWENLLYALADQNFPLDALFKLSFLLGGDTPF
jgi:hypothetical protein